MVGRLAASRGTVLEESSIGRLRTTAVGIIFVSEGKRLYTCEYLHCQKHFGTYDGDKHDPCFQTRFTMTLFERYLSHLSFGNLLFCITPVSYFYW